MNMFFDIESTSIPYEDLTEDQLCLLKNLYRSKRKSVQLKSNTLHVTEDESHKVLPPTMLKKFLLQNGAFHAGLSKILCVTLGWFDDNIMQFKTVSYSNFTEEGKILLSLSAAFENNYTLIGHNIFGYDIPYLQHKYMQHQIKIPTLLQLNGVKPRDMKHKDTMKIYRSSEFQNTSLENLCLTLGVHTPKDTGIKGSEISGKYEEMTQRDSVVQDEFLESVVKYCEADVKATYECYKKMGNVFDI